MYQETGLHIAIFHPSKFKDKVFNALFNHKDIDVNAQDRFGLTPLHVAVRTKEYKFFEKLLTHPNIDISIKDYPKTALETAEANKNSIEINRLIKARK